MSAVLLSRARRTFSSLGLNAGPAAIILVLAFITAVAAFSWPTLASLHPRWLDYGYTHGYMVLAIVVWLVMRQIVSTPTAAASASLVGLLALILCVLGILAAEASSATLLGQLLLPVLWIAAIWTAAGYANARRFIFAIGYLYFAIPIWDLLNGTLQRLTVAVVSLWIRIVDVPAYIEGNFIHIPSGTFEVAGGCSGLHAFIVGLALAWLMAILHHDRWRPRLILVGLALLLSLFANWIRVFSVVIAGHLTEMQHFLIVTDHYYFGWAVFFVCLTPLFLVDRSMQDDTPAVRSPVDAAERGVTLSSRRIAILASTILILFSGGWLQSELIEDSDLESSVVEFELPQVPGWRQVGEWRDESLPTFIGISGQAAGWYANGSDRVGAYIANYEVQGQAREVIYYANRPEGESASIRAQRNVAPAAGPKPASPFVEFEAMGRDGGSRLVWFGVRVGGTNTTTAFGAKVLQIAGLIRGRRDAQALVLTATCDGDCDGARNSLTAFAESAAETLYEAAFRSSSN